MRKEKLLTRLSKEFRTACKHRFKLSDSGLKEAQKEFCYITDAITRGPKTLRFQEVGKLRSLIEEIRDGK